MNTVKDLAKRIVRPSKTRQGVTRHRGVVQTVNATTVDIYLDGDTNTLLEDIRYLDSYAPTANDTVEVLVDGSDLFILGKLA